MMRRSRLRMLRQAFGFSQAQIATCSGVSTFFVSLLETGKARPGEQVREALAKLFNVDPSWLFDEGGNRDAK